MKVLFPQWESLSKAFGGGRRQGPAAWTERERSWLLPTALLLTGPPSVPRNLSFSVLGTQLSLRWEPPADMGGRQDVRYSVGCSQCRGAAVDGGPCQPCGGSVRFSPGASGLTAPAVRVNGLEPYANYTFNVEAQNGVSGLGTSTPASASLSVSMGHAGEQPGWAWKKPEGLRTPGPSGWAGSNRNAVEALSSFFPNPLDPSRLPESLSGLSLRLVKKEPRQLELTWAGSRPRSPGANLSYELHVLNQVWRGCGTVSGVPAGHTPASPGTG